MRVDYGWSPLCPVRETEDQMMSSLAEEILSEIEDEKLKEEVKRETKEWLTKTAPTRREIINLLLAAGARWDNCGDENDDEKQN